MIRRSCAHRVVFTLALGLSACGGAGGPAIPADRPSPVAANVPARPVGVVPLVPRPFEMSLGEGALVLDADTILIVDGHAPTRAIAEQLASWLGLPADRVQARPRTHADTRVVELAVDDPAGRDPSVTPPSPGAPGVDAGRGDGVEEAFDLEVTARGARLHASRPSGLRYAAEAFAALAGGRPVGASRAVRAGARTVPAVRVVDRPRVAFRAMHLDTARHPFSKDEVLRYVDLLALYRFNVFHWHLTDDQGFGFPSRSHPELSAGLPSFTLDEIRAVIAYAKERFITVVPEIESPGHTRAILAAHPELSCTGARLPVPRTWGVFDDVLCAGNPASSALVKDVLSDVMDVFPSRFVHLGGDEVPKARWSACPRCRARMARDRLDAEGLHGAFLRDVASVLASRGRRAMVWDDVLEGGPPPGAVVVAWQSQARGEAASRAGFDVVMAPLDAVYFNFWQSRTGREPGHEGYLPWTKVLAFSPSAAPLEMPASPSAPASAPPSAPPRASAPAASRPGVVLGGQGALWTEYVETVADLETLLLPRLAVLGEALWSGASSSTAAEAERDFGARFDAHRATLDRSGVGYFVSPPEGLRARRVFVDEATLALVPPSLFPGGVVRYTLDGAVPTDQSAAFSSPMTLHASTDVTAQLFLPGGARRSVEVRGRFEKSSLAPAMPARGVEVPGVNYTYYEGDFRKLPRFDALTPKRRGAQPSVSLPIAGARAERYAVLFEGAFDAPRDGVYRFVAHADDGVAVFVDGTRILVDDGEHAPRDAEGEAALAAGLHAVRVEFFQGKGGATLRLSCDGPGTREPACPLTRVQAGP